jgi:hypothetical protein
MRALVLAFLGTLFACGDAPPPTDGKVEGGQLATSLIQHLNSSLQLVAPFRCARIQNDRATPLLSGMKVTMRKATLEVESLAQKKTLTIAAVADARGSDEATLQGLAFLRDAFISEKVDLVISLGGHGTSKDDIYAVLSAISVDAPYLTLAIPGDRESVPGHREAVSELAKAGAKIIDGAQYRVLSLGTLNLATMPGIAMSANLIANHEGCLHTLEDSQELLRYLESEDVDFLLASYAPARQDSRPATDLGAGGIHVGEQELAPLSQSKALRLRIHGMVAQPEAPQSGKLRLGPGASSLASGSLDPLDGSSSALVISITGQRLDWKRIVAAP